MIKKLKYTNFIKNFNLVRYFIIGILSLCALMILCVTFVYLRLSEYHMNHALKIDTQGEIIPMKVVDLKKEAEAEAKNHIKTFIDLFFEYDQYNYLERIERSLWLGDKSIAQAYERLQNVDDWYNKVMQNSIIQRLKWKEPNEQIKLYEKEGEMQPFSLQTDLEINLSGHKLIYTINAQGKLQKTSRDFPRNPHGLMITNFSYKTYRKNQEQIQKEKNESDEQQN